MADPTLQHDLPVRLGEIVAEKYRIEGVIGSGGMGHVALATHLHLLQRVAIKFVRADVLDESSAMRLLREARAAGALRSEHVARVTDVGTLPSGIAYLVMEYLEGETLAQRLARETRLPVERAVWVGSQVCKGLAEAHRRGIVHRDVKPANLFLARQDDGAIVTKLLDFGIAKVSDPRIAVAPELTSSDHVLGTPRYMSPEQLTASARVDARADVWAVGVVLFECLTGAAPFAPGGSSYEVGARILAGVIPRVSESMPDVPPELDALVARCLAREPTARFADAAEVLAALEQTGIAPRALEADEAWPASREIVPTPRGLSAREPAVAATRVAPLRAPHPVASPAAPEAPRPEPADAAPRTEMMGTLVAPYTPASQAGSPVGTLHVPTRARLPRIALAGAVAALLTAGIVVRVRAKTERAEPSSFTPVPVTSDPVGAASAPVPVVPPAATSTSTSTGTNAPASTSAETSATSKDKPTPRPTTTRRPSARPMTRPPNER